MKKALLAVGTLIIATTIGYTGAMALMNNSSSMMAMVPTVAVQKYPTVVKPNSGTEPTDPCAAEKAKLANATAKYVGALERQINASDNFADLNARRINGTFGVTQAQVNNASTDLRTARRETSGAKIDKDIAQRALNKCTSGDKSSDSGYSSATETNPNPTPAPSSGTPTPIQ